MEFLLELLGEILLQIFAEALFELGLHSLAAPFKRESSPWMAGVGYAIFGALMGGASLWIVPHHLVLTPGWRLVNLVLAPFFAGMFMASIGAWRAKRGQQTLRIDRFSYGYLFALSLALVRFFFAA